MQSVSSSSGATSAGIPTLTLQDSLNLITTQLRNQDPLQPTDDSTFVTQMTELSQTQELSTVSQNISAVATSAAMSEATALIGKTVNTTDSNGTTGSGTVTAVMIQNGTPSVVVNGQEFPLTSISQVQ